MIYSIRHCRRLLAFLIGLAAAGLGQLYAQPQSNYQHLTQKQGLSSNYVLSFLEDHLGFIWIGTENGLNRFDGRHFLEYRHHPEDSTTINSNWITTLFEDSDHNLWVGTRNGLNRLDRQSGIFERISLQTENGSLFGDEITSCLEDKDGNIWVLSLRYGLFKVDMEKGGSPSIAKRVAYQQLNSASASSFRLSHLIEITEDYLWLATTQGLDRLQVSTNEILSLQIPNFTNYYRGEVDQIESQMSSEGQIFLLLGKELYQLEDKESNPRIVHLERVPARGAPDIPATQILRHLLWQDEQTLLTTDSRQIFEIDIRSGEQTPVLPAEGQPPLWSNDILGFFKDAKGGRWIGTAGRGVYFLPNERTLYTFYEHDAENPNTIAAGSVRSFTEDRQGHLWVGILGGGIEQFQYTEAAPGLKKLQTISQGPNGLSSHQVIKLLLDQEEELIWVATNNNGLNRVDLRSGAITSYRQRENDPNSLNGNRIWGLNQDLDGFIWVGTWAEGLDRLNPKDGTIKHFQAAPNRPDGLSSNSIRYIYRAPDDFLWIGTTRGLNRLDSQTETFTSYLHDPADSSSLSNNLVWSILQDRQGALWVGTDVGLNRLDITSNGFEHFYEEDGLPSNTIFGLTEAADGTIWISTDKGVARAIRGLDTVTFQKINVQDELGSLSFIPKALFQSPSNGQMLLGNASKMVLVNPALIGQDTFKHQLRIHSLTTFRFDQGKGRAETDYFVADKAQEIQLGHQDQSISLQLCDLAWQGTEDRQYEYQLFGFNGQWMSLPENMEVTFTNLDPGRYQFLVRSKDVSNIPSEAVQLLSLHVFPPWWESPPVYFAYLLFLIGFGYLVYRFQLNRQLQKQETENLKALDIFKNKLYTNITHEFKTPLTIISGVIEQVQGHDKVKQLVKRNSSNLLSLVNQILDLRKLEEGRLELKWVQANIIEYLQYLLASYEALAGLKDIELHFVPTQQEVLMDFDKEKVQRVLSNLLSNAIKFTPAGGDVYVRVTQSQFTEDEQATLCLIVQDSGIGISQEEQESIFDRFYQARSEVPKGKNGLQYRGPGGGTGIGLAMTKELVEFMGGRITVNSELGKGSYFTIILPLHQNAPIVPSEELTVKPILSPDLPLVTNELATGPYTGASSSLQSLLLIEDNTDVMQYLVSLLEDKYDLYLARDGQEGIELALEHIPDLIVSDVMMPIKDGFELCSTLKMDERTSHIPIILLTAKSGIDSRLEGLGRGADAYLAKPFDQRELFIRLEQLAAMRQQLRERYQGFEPVEASEEKNPYVQEDAFIHRLQEVIVSKMKDAEFGIHALCHEMGMSRSQLHLKLKALTNRSTSHVIRAVRLHKAKELLQENAMNVTQVSYEVGFNDPAYFSRKFTEEFGISPKKFMGNLS
ncbi:MAG: response regulator [Saprospiraceae bacterium]|nr:response regulator [Saprospiraceae bacterium]